MLEFIFLFIQLIFAVYITYFCFAFISGAPFVPSAHAVAQRMVELGSVHKDQTVYDLGSGDGRILKLAAGMGAKAIGFEINPFLVVTSNLRFFFSPYRHRIQTRWSNFWKHDLSQADVVFVYLLPWQMEKLADKLKKELKPGSVVVSNSFIFPHWKPVRKDMSLHVYVFRV